MQKIMNTSAMARQIMVRRAWGGVNTGFQYRSQGVRGGASDKMRRNTTMTDALRQATKRCTDTVDKSNDKNRNNLCSGTPPYFEIHWRL
jgi:hypothetical protein